MQSHSLSFLSLHHQSYWFNKKNKNMHFIIELSIIIWNFTLDLLEREFHS